MSVVSAEVVPNPSGDPPCKVVVRFKNEIIAEWPCHSVTEGEQQIIQALKGLAAEASKDA